MAEDNGNNARRGFLKAVCIGGLVAAMACDGQESHGETPGEPRSQEFRGLSKRGDVDEALRNAVAAAERSVRHPDAMVEWTLKRITGRSGGIAGFDEVTVVIEAVVR